MTTQNKTESKPKNILIRTPATRVNSRKQQRTQRNSLENIRFPIFFQGGLMWLPNRYQFSGKVCYISNKMKHIFKFKKHKIFIFDWPCKCMIEVVQLEHTQVKHDRSSIDIINRLRRWSAETIFPKKTCFSRIIYLVVNYRKPGRLQSKFGVFFISLKNWSAVFVEI